MPYTDSQNSHEKHDVIRIKREPLYVWLARLIWLIGLVVLLEYALGSHREHEPQAAITAGALFLMLLLAGVIVEVVRYVESQPESRLLRDMARNNAKPGAHNTNHQSTAEKTITDNTGDEDTLHD